MTFIVMALSTLAKVLDSSHSEPIRKKFSVSFDENQLKINQSEESIQIISNESEIGMIRIDASD